MVHYGGQQVPSDIVDSRGQAGVIWLQEVSARPPQRDRQSKTYSLLSIGMNNQFWESGKDEEEGSRWWRLELAQGEVLPGNKSGGFGRRANGTAHWTAVGQVREAEGRYEGGYDEGSGGVAVAS